MAAVISTWEQTGLFDPTNPSQRTLVRYAGMPGGYASYYYNRVPTTAKLQGVFNSLPDWMSMGVVGLLGLGLGFFGARAFGPTVKKKLHLSGARRRR